LVVVVGVYFMAQSPMPTDARSWVYWLSMPSYYLFVLLLVFVVCCLFMFSRWTVWLVPVAGALWLMYLLADMMVFKLYRFHISVFFIKMFFQDFKGLGLPLALQLIAGCTALGLLLLSVVAWRRCSMAPASQRAWRAAFWVPSLMVFAANQTVHVWAAAYQRAEITHFSAFMPVFAPIQDPKGAVWLSAKPRALCNTLCRLCLAPANPMPTS